MVDVVVLVLVDVADERVVGALSCHVLSDGVGVDHHDGQCVCLVRGCAGRLHGLCRYLRQCVVALVNELLHLRVQRRQVVERRLQSQCRQLRLPLLGQQLLYELVHLCRLLGVACRGVHPVVLNLGQQVLRILRLFARADVHQRLCHLLGGVVLLVALLVQLGYLFRQGLVGGQQVRLVLLGHGRVQLRDGVAHQCRRVLAHGLGNLRLAAVLELRHPRQVTVVRLPRYDVDELLNLFEIVYVHILLFYITIEMLFGRLRLKIIRKLISKIVRTLFFENFLFQFFYNFEHSDPESLAASCGRHKVQPAAAAASCGRHKA